MQVSCSPPLAISGSTGNPSGSERVPDEEEEEEEGEEGEEATARDHYKYNTIPLVIGAAHEEEDSYLVGGLKRQAKSLSRGEQGSARGAARHPRERYLTRAVRNI
jgi:hypothetical protein